MNQERAEFLQLYLTSNIVNFLYHNILLIVDISHHFQQWKWYKLNKTHKCVVNIK